LESAILVIKKLLTSFPAGSEGYNRLNVFLKTYITANKLKYELEEADSKYYCFLVFVYDKDSPNKNLIVYSSINRALKGLQISHSTLLDYINNKYIYKSNMIISFEPISPESFSEYSYKPEADNQLRKNIIVFNEENEPVFEFKSGREMARFFGIDGKIARAAIANGEYQDFRLVSKVVSFRKAIYVFDSNNHELICKLNSMADAMKYAKVGFYTLKNLIETGNACDGKIYSYQEKL